MMSASNQQSLILQVDNVEIDFNISKIIVNSKISCEVEIVLPGNRIVKENKEFTSRSGKPCLSQKFNM